MPFNVNGVCPGGNNVNDKATECLVQQGTADKDAVDALVALNGDMVSSVLVAAGNEALGLIDANGNGVAIKWAAADGNTGTAAVSTAKFNVGTRAKITFTAAFTDGQTVAIAIASIGTWAPVATTASGASKTPTENDHTLTITAGDAGSLLITAGDSIVLRCVSVDATGKKGKWTLESISGFAVAGETVYTGA